MVTISVENICQHGLTKTIAMQNVDIVTVFSRPFRILSRRSDRKIGQQKFDLLKVKVASTSKMTDFEYEQLIKYYKALNKKLRKEKGL